MSSGNAVYMLGSVPMIRVADWSTILAVVILWGLNLVVIRTGVQEIPPLFLTSLRLALVAIVIVPFFHPPWNKLPVILFLGVMMGVGHFGFMFLGLREIDAATAMIAIQFGIPLSTLLAWWVFGDRLEPTSIFGMILSLFGIVLLTGELVGGKLSFMLLIVLSGAVWAVSNVIVKCLSPIHPMTLNGWLSLCAIPPLLVLSAIFEHNQWHDLLQATWRGWGTVIYTAIGSSLIAHTLWYRLVAIYPLNKMVPITALVQVVGVVGGVLFLGESITLIRVSGCIITAFGVIIIGLNHSYFHRWG